MLDEPSDVVVALSGGLDSSVAAALLKAAGWEVHGLHFLLPAPPATRDARKETVQNLIEYLKIPLEIVDLRENFGRLIIDPFVDEYLQGLTPNPCVMCNQLIKFENLLRYAEQNGIQYLATGHYAKLRAQDESSCVGLWKAKDKSKDQSYFLQRLGQAFLARTVFPLGDMTKKEAAHKAVEIGLPVQSIPESQDICFLTEGDYRMFVEDQRGLEVGRRGNIVNDHREILGEHAGTYRYTIGQRHGLGIASSRPYYVKEIMPETNEVVVGRREDLYSKSVEAVRFNWVEGKPLQKAVETQAQVRYRHKAAPGRLEIISSDKVKFIFDTSQWAITPGQSLCCYEGDRVLGGGVIEKSD